MRNWSPTDARSRRAWGLARRTPRLQRSPLSHSLRAGRAADAVAAARHADGAARVVRPAAAGRRRAGSSAPGDSRACHSCSSTSSTIRRAGDWPADTAAASSRPAPRCLPPRSARFTRRFGVKIHAFYGTTETGGIAFDDSDDPDDAERSGGALAGRHARLCGRDGRAAAAAVHVRSAAVATGYAGRDRGDFIDDGFLTGDYGAIDSAGRLTLSGRVVDRSSTSPAGRCSRRKSRPCCGRCRASATSGCSAAQDERRGEHVVACIVLRLDVEPTDGGGRAAVLRRPSGTAQDAARGRVRRRDTADRARQDRSRGARRLDSTAAGAGAVEAVCYIRPDLGRSLSRTCPAATTRPGVSDERVEARRMGARGRGEGSRGRSFRRSTAASKRRPFQPKWAPAPLLKSRERTKPQLGWPRTTDSLCPTCVRETRARILSGAMPIRVAGQRARRRDQGADPRARRQGRHREDLPDPRHASSTRWRSTRRSCSRLESLFPGPRLSRPSPTRCTTTAPRRSSTGAARC